MPNVKRVRADMHNDAMHEYDTVPYGGDHGKQNSN